MEQRAGPIADILQDGRLVVCCGPGGVGKTTTAAALGLRAVLDGRKVIVLTIDPAKRLANSLGLNALTNEPQRIELDAIAERNDAPIAQDLDDHPGDTTEEGGEMWAMMLDQEETFEELLQRNAPDSSTLERSRENNIYKLMSSALHGIHEYAALEKLHDLYTGGYFDLVVLDTPPTANALDFLDAPKRLRRFFDRRIMKWFLPSENRSSGFFGKLFNPGSVVLKLLSKLFGESFVQDLTEFFDTFQYLQETLEERGELIEYILKDVRTHFLLITSADPRRIEEAFHFQEKLRDLDQEARAFVVNRVTPQFSLSDIEELETEDLVAFLEEKGLKETVDAEELLEQLEEHYASLARLAYRDRQSIDKLAEKVGRELLQLVPILGQDIHSIEQLLELSHFLTPEQKPAGT